MAVLKHTGRQRDVQVVEQAAHLGTGGAAAVQLSAKRKRAQWLKPMWASFRVAMSALQMMGLEAPKSGQGAFLCKSMVPLCC